MRTTFVGRRTVEHLFDRPDWRRALERERDRGTAGNTQVPPTLFFVSVVVRAASGRLLCLRRSLSVRTAPAMWSIGINETKKYDAEPGREEDVVTWLGWSEPAAGFYAVVFVRSRLGEVEIEESSPDGVNPWIAELSPVVAVEAWRFRHAF